MEMKKMYHNSSDELYNLLKDPELKDKIIVVNSVKMEKRFLQLLIDIIPICILTFVISFFYQNKYLYVIFYFTYFFICESIWTTSLGKKIMKHKIITSDFNKFDVSTALIRSFCRIIPFDSLTCLGNYSYGLHDKLSNTFVVSESEYGRIQKLIYSQKTIDSEKKLPPT